MPWNKGLTKESDERVSKYSQKLRGRTFSSEHRKRISEAARTRDLKGDRNPSKRLDVRRKISARAKERWKRISKDARRIILKKVLEKYLENLRNMSPTERRQLAIKKSEATKRRYQYYALYLLRIHIQLIFISWYASNSARLLSLF